ncbi:EAL domain-containing protein [Hoeflea sp.]|uniref:putative bifunctional diguanylate cyclase/phosphodiesterase n=1 Tax=Hoeflea sp. TaxID=1940281 RepID=UPI00374A2246
MLAARKLTSQILALRNSTEALVSGDYNVAVDVDCACEVGGLADSFRKMVERLNSNIFRMNQLAYVDGVTGLPNRAMSFHLLSRLTTAPDMGSSTVLYIDLDGFKRVNDLYGHEAGDELLRAVSVRIASAFNRSLESMESYMTPIGEPCDEPPGDVVLARVSGDEFVVLLPPNSEQADVLAAKILDRMHEPFKIAGATVNIGASIGMARYPEDASTPEELLNIADFAMYEAKRNGRDRVVASSPSLRASWQDRRDVERDLRQAIENDDITLAYQPRLTTGELNCSAVEALARWHHPTRGNISPSVFVPIAEQGGLMPLLGATVFEKAVQQCRIWQDDGLDLSVSVNVSPAEFAAPDLVARLISILKRHDVASDLIEIEITETMAMRDFETTQEQMTGLRNAGFRIAIDDFGTGYSNLSQLSRLPYTSVKLDRSLILDVLRRDTGLSILHAVTSMAKALGQSTIAEGIETDTQYEAIKALGCEEVQGFLFARPMTPDRIPDFVYRTQSEGLQLKTA